MEFIVRDTSALSSPVGFPPIVGNIPICKAYAYPRLRFPTVPRHMRAIPSVTYAFPNAFNFQLEH